MIQDSCLIVIICGSILNLFIFFKCHWSCVWIKTNMGIIDSYFISDIQWNRIGFMFCCSIFEKTTIFAILAKNLFFNNTYGQTHSKFWYLLSIFNEALKYFALLHFKYIINSEILSIIYVLAWSQQKVLYASYYIHR